MLACMQEMRDCHMSSRHGDAARDHNDTNDSNNSADVVDKLTAYCQKPFIKESRERVHGLSSSSISYCPYCLSAERMN